MQEKSSPPRPTTYQSENVNVSGMATRIQSNRDHPIYVREWRKRAKLTGQQLADRIGTTKQTISRWENSTRDMTRKDMAAVADALGLEIAHLFINPDRSHLNRLLADALQRLDEMERANRERA